MDIRVNDGLPYMHYVQKVKNMRGFNKFRRNGRTGRMSATKKAFIAGVKAGKRSARNHKSGKKRWY